MIRLKNIDYKSLDLAYFKKPLDKDKFEAFKSILNDYKNNLLKYSSLNEDGLVANALNVFLKELGFDTIIKEKQKGKSEIDLSIIKDEDTQIIIEAKKSSNKTEMIAKDEANKKSLHEAILYYFRQRAQNNTSLKYIIISDFYRFYFFKALHFEKFFYQNKTIKKLFGNLNFSSLLSNNNEFYNELKDILTKENIQIPIFYIDFAELFDNKSKDYVLFYKIFNKEFLLDEFDYNDNNIIDKTFYDELLYILGLKKDNKYKLSISDESLDHQGTLYHNIFKNLKPSLQSFDNIMSLEILWLNRILFLKLIESNLIRFNNYNKNLKFLSYDKIRDFNTLKDLFFNIFAKEHKDRDKNSSFFHLPYLNSSLFTIKPIEEELLKIQDLNNDLSLSYYKNTSIKDKNGKRPKGSIPFLKYLFDFLDAFDFGSDKNKLNQSQEELFYDKILINPSILGTLFEKLNAYKDGSFYTPNAITSYMCKTSLESLVLAKFQAHFSINASDLDELASKIILNINIDSNFRSKAIKVLKDIKIIDPAVGSGHFLVSALNEMIYIYYKLGLIDTNTLKYISDLYILNDEVYIDNFNYTRPKNPKDKNHLIQKTLFKLKKIIIENNLFGVDINANSVEICRLRLWIELLKNSYYLFKNDENYDEAYEAHQMQTLPNIDINIKCGNSLISYLSLDKKLKDSNNIKNKIKEYKTLVSDYKNGFKSKIDLTNKIKEIQETFFNTCFRIENKAQLDKFNNKCKKYSDSFGDYLIKDHKKFKNFIYPSFDGFLDLDKTKAAKAFKELEQDYEDLYNLNAHNPFEYRYQFPELLDDNGDFVGFDLVIGNPPYDVTKKTQWPQYKWNKDLYTMFFEMSLKITKQNGYLNFITPRFWLVNKDNEEMRKYFLNSVNLILLVETNPFKKVATENIITFMQNCNPKSNKIKHYKKINNNFIYIADIDKKEFLINSKSEIIFNIDKNLLILFNKIHKNTIPLKLLMQTKRGAEKCSKKFIKNFKSGMKILIGEDVRAYNIKWNNTFVDTSLKDIQRLLDFFNTKDLIYLRRVDNRLSACMSNEKFAFTKNIYGIKIINNKYESKFILGLLNSKLLNIYYLNKFTTKKEDIFPEIQTNFYEQLPIPKITPQNQNIVSNIIKLVDEILLDQSRLEANIEQIDELVYSLYDLNIDEINIIKASLKNK